MDETPLIKGRITVLYSEIPVQGAVVTAHGVGDPRSRQAVSDVHGNYMLNGLKRTAYLVEVAAKGFGSEIRENALPDRGELDFQLELPGKLRGTVRPVKRFTVELIQADYQIDRMSLPSITMETAFHRAYHGKHRRFERLHDFETTDGSFEIEGLGRGKYHVLVSSRGYGVSALVDAVNVIPGEESFVELELFPSQSIRGSVVNGDSLEAISGAWVRAVYPLHTRLGDPLLEQRAVTTDWEGRFELESVLKESTNVEIRHTGFAPKFCPLVFERGGMRIAGAGIDGVTLHENELKIYLVQEKDTGALAGFVSGSIHSDGTPPLIGIQGKRGFFEVIATEESGAFRREGLSPGKYTVFLFKGGEIMEGMEAVVAAGEETEVVLGNEEGACIRGTVYAGIKAYHGQGFVILEGEVDSERRIRRICPLRNGAYSLHGLQAGSGSINVWPHSGMGSDFKYRKEVSWGYGDEVLVDLHLPDTELLVQVRDEAVGKGLSGAVFKLCRDPSFGTINELDFRGALLQASRDDGKALLRGLPPGEYRIGIFADGYDRFQAKLEVHEAGRSEFAAAMTRIGY